MPVSQIEETKFSFEVVRHILGDSWRVIRIVWRGRKWLVLSLGAIVAVLAVSPFLMSGARGLLINELVRQAAARTFTFQLLIFLGLVAAVGIVQELFSAIRGYTDRRFWFFLEEKVETMVHEKEGAIDIAAYEDPRYHNLLLRVREQGMWRFQNFVDRQFFFLENM